MDSFGYTDDFKVIVTKQVAMNKATDNIQAWLNTNMILPNTKKKHTLNIKGNLEAHLCNAKLTPVQSQRDLGLIVQQNLSWNENCKRISNKAMGALFQIKRNLTSNCNWRIKLNAYAGYVVPIAVYASQTWLPNKGNLTEFEKVHHHAIKWIIDSDFGYRNRLIKFQILPLSLYVEMHDLPMLLSIKTGEFDVESSIENEKICDTTRQSNRGEFKFSKPRLNKTNENFLRRTKLLYNYVLRVNESFGKYLNKATIQNIYWNFFTKQYTEENKCTWRVICRCGNCNSLSKIKRN